MGATISVDRLNDTTNKFASARSSVTSRHEESKFIRPLNLDSLDFETIEKPKNTLEPEKPQLPNDSRSSEYVYSNMTSVNSSAQGINKGVVHLETLKSESDVNGGYRRNASDSIPRSLDLNASVADVSPSNPTLTIEIDEDARRHSIAVPIAKLVSTSARKLTKSNSCSTLFVEGTLAKANLEQMLRCAATAISLSIRNSHETKCFRSHDIFSEKLNPLFYDMQVLRKLPDSNAVYKFLHAIFRAIQLNSECAIISLIYLERMMNNTGVTMYYSNWRRVLLGAILLASKVWDDQAVWNTDFCSFFTSVHVKDMNNLERWYLKAIDYNVSVKGSIYAKYYFELRDIVDNKSTRLLKPLKRKDASKVEATTMFNQYEPARFEARRFTNEVKEIARSKSDYLVQNPASAVIM